MHRSLPSRTDCGPAVGIFEGSCVRCHGGDGAGGELGPSIVRSDGVGATAPEALRSLIRVGIPESGMPASSLDASELETLVTFVRSLVAAAAERPVVADRAAMIEPPRPIPFAEIADPRPGEWPTYDGRLSGNRHSALDQIDVNNVVDLSVDWIFPIRNASRLRVTPIVVDGTMYATTANQVFALDATTGREIWHYSRPRTRGIPGDAGINRGVAVLDDRVFLATDDAHLIALHRRTGGLIWETEMADHREHYGATSAPLVVKDMVISGTSGGDEGVRGFPGGIQCRNRSGALALLDDSPSRRAALGDVDSAGPWSTDARPRGLPGPTIPKPTCFTGPPATHAPDFNGDERLGDNLYSSSVLALDPDDGSLSWYFQYTPHDVHDVGRPADPHAHRRALRRYRTKAARPGEPQRVLLTCWIG